MRVRFFSTVELVNRLEAEARAGRQGRIADYLTRMDFVILDELDYLAAIAQQSCAPLRPARRPIGLPTRLPAL